MPHQLTKLTPNLIVADLSRSIAFYRDVLGFTLQTTVPDAPPYVFAIVQSGAVEIFHNAPEPAMAEYPAFKGRPIGGTLTLFIQVDDVRAAHEALKNEVEIVMPLETKWYGVTEFAFTDPDGYVITFAQPETGA
jgi:catechol 2,3-dioxygenase-like lactoylglutathione lyase family enzyme